MSSNPLDMALSDLIKTNKNTQSNNRRRNFNNRRQGGANKNNASKSLINSRKRRRVQSKSAEGSKILISNLNFKVTSKDLKELFNDIGPVKSATIDFLSNGKSKGTGQVIFIRGNDAKRAINKYNNVELDGRAMKIEMVLTSTSSIINSLNELKKQNSLRARRNRINRRRRNNNNKPKPKTSDELDAEMDSYMKIDDNINNNIQTNAVNNTAPVILA